VPSSIDLQRNRQQHRVPVDELPKISTGKIQKNVVRDNFARHYSIE
jgi:acyl-coenzyme A synthetase/AMP-(fatty) acid ligase